MLTNKQRRIAAERQAELTETLIVAVRRYVSERDNPAPDLTMRRIEFDRLKQALDAYDQDKAQGNDKRYVPDRTR